MSNVNKGDEWVSEGRAYEVVEVQGEGNDALIVLAPRDNVDDTQTFTTAVIDLKKNWSKPKRNPQ